MTSLRRSSTPRTDVQLIGFDSDVALLAVAQIAALSAACLACVTDVTTRRIPNVLTFSTAACALVFHSLSEGWSGAGHASAGLVTGLLMFLPLFLLRGMGGGDVKLLTALALWIEPTWFLKLLLMMALVGGLLTLVMGAWHIARRQRDRLAIPYGVAIAIAGLWVLGVHSIPAAQSALAG